MEYYSNDLVPMKWSSERCAHIESIKFCCMGQCVSAEEYPLLEPISLQTDIPINIENGLFYVEVKAVKFGFIALGFTADEMPVTDVVGWADNSCGFHGDVGMCFNESTVGVNFGRKLKKGDWLGMGLNMLKQECFYTINGQLFGTAFRGIPTQLYPAVTLVSSKEEIISNFGMQDFKFLPVYDMMEEIATELRYCR